MFLVLFILLGQGALSVNGLNITNTSDSLTSPRLWIQVQVLKRPLCSLKLTLTFLVVFLNNLSPLEKVMISKVHLMDKATQSATLSSIRHWLTGTPALQVPSTSLWQCASTWMCARGMAQVTRAVCTRHADVRGVVWFVAGRCVSTFHSWSALFFQLLCVFELCLISGFFISSFYFAFLWSWTPRPFCEGLRPSHSPTGAGAQ